MLRSVRKVNENIVTEGRSLVINDPAVPWEDIPYGSLMVRPDSGKFYVKLIGKTEWEEITFQGGSIGPGWGSDIPLGSLKLVDAQRMSMEAEKAIKTLELMIGGQNTIWSTTFAIGESLNQSRDKIINLFETIKAGSSSTFESIMVKDAREAFNALETGAITLYEILTGTRTESIFEGLEVSIVRNGINELFEIIYPGTHIANEIVDPEIIAKETRSLYEIIGMDTPAWMADSNLSSMKEKEILNGLRREMDELNDIIYVENEQPSTFSRMSTESDMESLLMRIGELEAQMARFSELVEK